MFVSHLEQYIEFEKKHGAAIQELKDHKIATAREAADIMERLVKDDYADTAAVEEKWGKFPYEKTTYADGSVSYRHLTPAGYDEDMRAAYAKARAAIDKDLRRLGEIIERNMMDW
jgi:coenzyme F420-reducing hydrogenase alpha subunit